jgi:hypothetical protein
MVTIATFAAMTLLYVVFSKLVPIISVWELKVGEHDRVEAAPGVEEARRVGSSRP